MPSVSRSAIALLSAPPVKSADPGQLIGGDALIGGRVHQVPDDIEKLLASGAR